MVDDPLSRRVYMCKDVEWLTEVCACSLFVYDAHALFRYLAMSRTNGVLMQVSIVADLFAFLFLGRIIDHRERLWLLEAVYDPHSSYTRSGYLNLLIQNKTLVYKYKSIVGLKRNSRQRGKALTVFFKHVLRCIIPVASTVF